MRWNRAPRHFNSNHGCIALEKSKNQNPQHLQVFVVLVGALGHVRGQRSHQAIAHQNAKKRPDQGCCDLAANLFRRPADRAHGNYHAQHCGHDTQAGRASATVLSEEMGATAPR
jgi:hypothetical protein